jgi:hypothetical protein
MFWANFKMELEDMFIYSRRMDPWLFVLAVIGNRPSLTLAQLNTS